MSFGRLTSYHHGLVEAIDSLLHDQDLDGAEGGMDVRVVARMGSEAALREEERGRKSDSSCSHWEDDDDGPDSGCQQLRTHSIISSLERASARSSSKMEVRPQ